MAAQKVHELKPRARMIRLCFGRGAGLREFARMLGMDEGQYLKLESKGCAPRGEGRAAYVRGLSRLPEIGDPEALVLWALTGAGAPQELFLPAFVLSFGEDLASLSRRKSDYIELPAAFLLDKLEPAVRRAAAAEVTKEGAFNHELVEVAADLHRLIKSAVTTADDQDGSASTRKLLQFGRIAA